MDQKDKKQIENGLKLFKRAKYGDMEGLEVLAAASFYYWMQAQLVEPPPQEIKPQPSDMVFRNDEKNGWVEEQAPLPETKAEKKPKRSKKK